MTGTGATPVDGGWDAWLDGVERQAEELAARMLAGESFRWTAPPAPDVPATAEQAARAKTLHVLLADLLGAGEAQRDDLARRLHDLRPARAVQNRWESVGSTLDISG